jgi:hypothetical protein
MGNEYFLTFRRANCGLRLPSGRGITAVFRGFFDDFLGLQRFCWESAENCWSPPHFQRKMRRGKLSQTPSHFSILVVAVDPSFFNNNQQIMREALFWRLRLGGVAGWLWAFPQADASEAALVALPTLPAPYLMALLVFVLYVVKNFLRLPQDGCWGRLLFGVGLCFVV